MNNLLSPPSQSLAWTHRPGVGESSWFREYSSLLALLLKGTMSQTSLLSISSKKLPWEGTQVPILFLAAGGMWISRAALPPHHRDYFLCNFFEQWSTFYSGSNFFTDAFQMLFVDLCITNSLTCLSQHEGRDTFCQVSIGFVGAGSCCHSKWDQDVTIPAWEGFS